MSDDLKMPKLLGPQARSERKRREARKKRRNDFAVPCNHNNWDNVRLKKDISTLRCRVCQAQFKISRKVGVGIPKCPDFSATEKCDKENCKLLHIHAVKQTLGERLSMHGAHVLNKVPKSVREEAEGAHIESILAKIEDLDWEGLKIDMSNEESKAELGAGLDQDSNGDGFENSSHSHSNRSAPLTPEGVESSAAPFPTSQQVVQPTIVYDPRSGVWSQVMLPAVPQQQVVPSFQCQ